MKNDTIYDFVFPTKLLLPFFYDNDGVIHVTFRVKLF